MLSKDDCLIEHKINLNKALIKKIENNNILSFLFN